jgi:hypothetical protein
MVIVYVPTLLTELVYHETTLVIASNAMNEVEVTPVGGVTTIE